MQAVDPTGALVCFVCTYSDPILVLHAHFFLPRPTQVQVLAPYRVKRKLKPWIPRDITIAKFCEREKSIVAGSSDGYIYIYSYAELPNINEISRHHSSSSSIRSIDVHPTEAYVMSSAHNCCAINRWKWTRSWSTFFHHTGSVTVLKCDPNNYRKFAGGSSDGTVKVSFHYFLGIFFVVIPVLYRTYLNMHNPKKFHTTIRFKFCPKKLIIVS